jgi:carboxylesterase
MPVLRGHGEQSPEALQGVTWHDWVADAETALEDLLTEVERAIVFGHSMGGLLALTLAAEHAGAIDSIIVAAAAVQFASPLAPGRPLHFLVPLLRRILKKQDVPPVYADPELIRHDATYPWAPIDAVASLLEFSQVTRSRLGEVRSPVLILQSRKDTRVAPESADIISSDISTPPDQKRIVWFEETDHEMFLDCERESAIRTVVEFVQGRVALGVEGTDAPTALSYSVRGG